MNIYQQIAQGLNIRLQQVEATVKLLDEGATVPFIARYRKEVTGSLDDTQLRDLQEQLIYLRELEERKEFVIGSIEKQDKLTEELKQRILAATDKATVEDLYLPYKPKRRTKAQIAREAGIEPLAILLWKTTGYNLEEVASPYINAEQGFTTTKEVLDGARQILMEDFSQDAQLLADSRQFVWENAQLTSRVIDDKQTEGAKFTDYFAYSEAIKKIPSHRALALLRGQREGFLRLNLELNPEQTAYCIQKVANTFSIPANPDPWLKESVEWTWKIKLALKIELDLMGQLRENAELEAIKVFANNLHHLLMAAPAGAKVTMGLDPGYRTGVKVVVIDQTGKLLTYTVIFPHPPQNEWQESLDKLAKLCNEFHVDLISIGNGTASRETDKLAIELIKLLPQLKLNKIVVSEAGASVYSASKRAAEEFPNLDVTYRGAVSIARRLQDPLAELVKIEPKAIGVGQYQHDVNQIKLSRMLDAVVEDCVNAVGVDVNTASVPLLQQVAGLNETIAQNVVTYRDQHGAFHNRTELKKVSRLGDKAFEQAAGFLRINQGDNPLDASAVHPEAYPVVADILTKQNKSLKDLMGNQTALKALKPQEYVTEQFGLPTIMDILRELEKPGRDPRPEFKTAEFREGIETLADLKPGLELEGVITNVANFGAFVDIGVHQDGLVHISQLADRFVEDPHKVVKVGDVVKVRVLEIDIARKRISLT
ncbi:MAG: Tex family protein, partial [Gammaproteobacteria bacterium]